jgi:hypothetical protein
MKYFGDEERCYATMHRSGNQCGDHFGVLLGLNNILTSYNMNSMSSISNNFLMWYVV